MTSVTLSLELPVAVSNSRQDDPDYKPWGRRLFSDVNDTLEIGAMIYRLQINFDPYGTTKKGKRGPPQKAKAKLKGKVYETEENAAWPNGRKGTNVVAVTPETTIRFQAHRNGKKIKLTQVAQPTEATDININSGALSGYTLAWGASTDIPADGIQGDDGENMKGIISAWIKLIEEPSIQSEFTLNATPFVPIGINVTSPPDVPVKGDTSIAWGWDWDIKPAS